MNSEFNLSKEQANSFDLYLKSLTSDHKELNSNKMILQLRQALQVVDSPVSVDFTTNIKKSKIEKSVKPKDASEKRKERKKKQANKEEPNSFTCFDLLSTTDSKIHKYVNLNDIYR